LVGAAKSGADNVSSQLSKNGGDRSKTDYGEVLKAGFQGAMTGAVHMFKTELYAGINIGVQYISNMTRIANTIQKICLRIINMRIDRWNLMQEEKK